MLRLKAFLLLAIVILPTATLIPFGSLWLWQNGYILTWVVGSFIFTIVMYAVAASGLNSLVKRGGAKDRGASGSTDPKEDAAWAAIETFVSAIEPTSIKNRDDLADVAAKTVGIVAREFHPDDKTPVWNFTVPELLLLTERVSARLRPVFIDSIPLAEQLSVGQMLRLYEWRSVAGIAENAYDIWRLVRAINPVTAVTQEARERVTKQILTSVRDDLTHRLIRIIVEQIGSAAIDLYSGRLRSAGAGAAKSGALAKPYDEPGAIPKSRLRTVLGEAQKLGRSARAVYTRRDRKK